MKLNCYYILFFLFFFTKSPAQSKFAVFKNIGYAFNNSIELKETVVEKSKGYFVEIGFNYRLFQLKSSQIEIGLAGKTIFASGNVNGQSFNTTTFRLTAPLKWVFPIPSTKIEIASGFVFQNNVDFQEFDLRLRDKYSWRVNYLLETRISLKNQAHLSIGGSFNIRKIPDIYFINDPKISFNIGFQKTLFSKRKKITNSES